MDPLSLVAIATALGAYGLISRRAEHSPLTAPMFFVATGLALGDDGLGWLALDLDGEMLHGMAEITLVLVLFIDASRIDLACLRREGSLPLRLLIVGLPLTVLAGAAAALLVLPGVTPLQAVLVAAILAPTDAALGQAVVSNTRVPVRIRQTLNVESGLNDGLALPLVLLVASLAGARGHEGDLGFWLRFAALELVLGPLVGALVGYGGGRLVEIGARAGWIADSFERLAGLGLAVLAFAAAELVGGNGFIAAFIGGMTLGNSARSICPRLHAFGEAEGQLLTLFVFVAFGATMVPEALRHLDAPIFLYALLSLTVVRMLPVALSLAGTGLHAASVAFVGWFGPRGLASILFTLLVVEQGVLPGGRFVETVVVLTVLASTFLHGMTSWPLARRYGALASEHERMTEERVVVEEHPLRAGAPSRAAP